MLESATGGWKVSDFCSQCVSLLQHAGWAHTRVGGGFDKMDHPGIERRSIAAARKTWTGSIRDPKQACFLPLAVFSIRAKGAATTQDSRADTSKTRALIWIK
jgi:hypothetical protein